MAEEMHEAAAVAVTIEDGAVIVQGWDYGDNDKLEEIFRLELTPDLARELAFQLTRNSILLEEETA